MLTILRILIVVLIFQVIFFTKASALERNTTEYFDSYQIGIIMNRLERGIQHQNLDLIISIMYFDSTKSNTDQQMVVSDLSKNINGLFKSFDAGVQYDVATSLEKAIRPKPVEHFTSTWDFTVNFKETMISKDRKEAYLVLEIGFPFMPADSANLVERPTEEIEKMSVHEKEQAMRFSFIKVKLLNINNTWLVSSLDEFSSYLHKTATFHDAYLKSVKDYSSVISRKSKNTDSD